jgi:hypothetical protein
MIDSLGQYFFIGLNDILLECIKLNMFQKLAKENELLYTCFSAKKIYNTSSFEMMYFS